MKDNDGYLDYKYSLAILQKLNKFVESDPKLSLLFLCKGYNLWQAYQQPIFGDILGWSNKKDIDAIIPKASFIVLIKMSILAIFTFLLSIISGIYLVLARTEILVFTLDKTTGKFKNDFRLDPLYEALQKTSSSYFEIVHTVIGRGMLKNLLYRARPVVYLESPDFLSSFNVVFNKFKLSRYLRSLDMTAFTKEERDLIFTILIKYGSSVSISRYRILFLRGLLYFSSVKQILAIDDVRTINEIIIASKLSGVDFYSIQHGHFTKYHVGWLKMTDLPGRNICPDKTFVWSKYWKGELLRLGTYFFPDQIIVGGGTKNRSFIPRKKSSNRISVLIPYEKNAPKKEIFQYIKKIFAYDDIEVVFKLRQDQEKMEQISEYGLLPYIDKIKLARTTDDMLDDIDLAIGTYSTFLYDMVEQGRPVAIIETSIDYGEGMVANGLADMIFIDGNLHDDLLKISQTSDAELRKRRIKFIDSESELIMTESLVKVICDKFKQ
ncbi:MAG: hypothetical protein AB200_01650 [Parcubacteria bacterium C7867-005]|nr:MAG: hypothetical protein AB200_01650 [Parcubacteria bacterium C7867-005]